MEKKRINRPLSAGIQRSLPGGNGAARFDNDMEHIRMTCGMSSVYGLGDRLIQSIAFAPDPFPAQEKGLIFETEGDTLSQTFKSEHEHKAHEEKSWCAL
jgi:hypothetical protein